MNSTLTDSEREYITQELARNEQSLAKLLAKGRVSTGKAISLSADIRRLRAMLEKS